MAGSNVEVWWRTAERNSWQQTIDRRTDRRLKQHQLRAFKQSCPQRLLAFGHKQAYGRMLYAV